MKLHPDFVLREIADSYIVVPICENADRLHGVLSLSDTGAFLWKQLQSDQTVDSLVSALTAEYDVSADRAREGVEKFLLSIKEIGCLDEQ